VASCKSHFFVRESSGFIKTEEPTQLWSSVRITMKFGLSAEQIGEKAKNRNKPGSEFLIECIREFSKDVFGVLQKI